MKSFDSGVKPLPSEAKITAPASNEKMHRYKEPTNEGLQTLAAVHGNTEEMTPKYQKRQFSALSSKSLNQTCSSRQKRVSQTIVEKVIKNHRTGSSLSSVKFKNLSQFSRVGFGRQSNEQNSVIL